MALLWGAGGEEDTYKARTLRERAYLRSHNPNTLAIAIDVDMLDSDNEE
jgi:hypothetical protein